MSGQDYAQAAPENPTPETPQENPAIKTQSPEEREHAELQQKLENIRSRYSNNQVLDENRLLKDFHETKKAFTQATQRLAELEKQPEEPPPQEPPQEAPKEEPPEEPKAPKGYAKERLREALEFMASKNLGELPEDFRGSIHPDPEVEEALVSAEVTKLSAWSSEFKTRLGDNIEQINALATWANDNGYGEVYQSLVREGHNNKAQALLTLDGLVARFYAASQQTPEAAPVRGRPATPQANPFATMDDPAQLKAYARKFWNEGARNGEPDATHQYEQVVARMETLGIA